MSGASPWATCIRCGAARQGTERFCPRCGLDYWSVGPGGEVATPPIDTKKPNETIGLIAGLAWIGSALAIGYLAFLQLQYAGLGLPDSDDAMGLATWNGVSAAITVFFGARLILGVDRRFLVSAIGWAVVTVAWGMLQISQGFTHEVFLIATVLAGVAGVLSFADWRQRENPQPAGPKTSEPKPTAAKKSGWRESLTGIAVIVIGTAVILYLVSR